MRALRRVDLECREEIYQKIAIYVERLTRVWKPQAVLLFGSFARDDVHEGSDVDIAVIADFREPFLDRIRRLLDLNEGLSLPLEPVGYTPEEFRTMWRVGNRFVREVAAHGRVLHGDLAGVFPGRRLRGRRDDGTA
ncbi:hypothetical protein HRbin11_00996 [bacterium HR11]|nr:hypothetical protein HRbin11_00996 [bacterium HR11]